MIEKGREREREKVGEERKGERGEKRVTEYPTPYWLTYGINRLSCMLREKFIQQTLHLDNLFCLNGYVSSLALEINSIMLEIL